MFTPFETGGECLDLLLGHQRHVPLGDAAIAQKRLVDRVLGVDERIADAVDVICHAATSPEGFINGGERSGDRTACRSCAPDTKAASKAEGAKYTPRASKCVEKAAVLLSVRALHVGEATHGFIGEEQAEHAAHGVEDEGHAVLFARRW